MGKQELQISQHLCQVMNQALMIYALIIVYAGGAEADKQVRAAIEKALAPAALAGNANPSVFALNRSDRTSENSNSSFSVKSPQYAGCAFLCAVWDRLALAREYNMQILAEPAVHESAEEERLAGEPTLVTNGCQR